MPARLSHAGLGLARAAVVACGVATATAQSLTPALRVTVMTTVGEEVKGLFLGATESEVTVESQGRKITLPLRDVTYLAFAASPPSGAAIAYPSPMTPASQLRAECLALENEGRLSEALARCKEAERLDPSDPLTVKALARTRQKIRSREGREKAAPYKRLVTVLKDARRYAESAACFDEAIRLDPNDEKFYSENRAIRETWTPSSCPVDATSGRTQ